MCVYKVGSLEEMCDMMCDNVVPEQRPEWWIFTFGCGQEHEGKYVRIHGTFEEARRKMFREYGDRWAFQYSQEEWDEWKERIPEYVPAETLLREIE